uniref:Uncharacterized protein n=1 Tax=Anguilla anguilla TaxID=7936 RepID=A0A0E9WIZ8_ANGAN
MLTQNQKKTTTPQHFGIKFLYIIHSLAVCNHVEFSFASVAMMRKHPANQQSQVRSAVV